MCLIRSVNTTAPSLADQFFDIIESIIRAIGRHTGVGRPRDPAVEPILALVLLRLAKLRSRFRALFAKFRAGTLAKPRARTRQPSATPRPAAPPEAPKLPPQSRGWLIRLLAEPWHVNSLRHWLERWLADPELLALAQVAPQVGRLLRPLCNMLNMDIPAFLQLPQRERPPSERPPVAERPPRKRPPRKRRPAAERPARPVDVEKMSSYAYGRLVHPPRDNNCPPIRLGYAPAKPFPKPDSE